MSKKHPKKPTKKETYEQVGRMVENIYLSGYIDTNQMYKMTFFKGVVAGLGGVIGATVLVALVIWLLSLFNYTPLQPLIEPVTDTIKTNLESEK